MLIKDLNDPPTPLVDDASLRQRIYERYWHFNGRRYEKELPDMLPRSNVSVFTHGDIAPRNTLVDSSGSITGFVDWENSGCYPDYWEYANIMKPSGDNDWQKWMELTARWKPDISGIVTARGVLF